MAETELEILQDIRDLLGCIVANNGSLLEQLNEKQKSELKNKIELKKNINLS
jgi:hypothetical protein